MNIAGGGAGSFSAATGKTDDPIRGSISLLAAMHRGMAVINAIMAALSSLAIGAAAAILTWEVIGRYFLSIPSSWQDELSTFLLIGATFGAAAWTQARRAHVSIDAIAVLLPPRADRWRRFVADLVSFAFCSFFTVKVWELLAEAWTEGQTTPSAWGAPLWIPYGCMAAGMALLSLQILLQILSGSPSREIGEPVT
jgi:TRAP-type C4-dicarboxylate transport system permease small subunit